MRTVFNFNAGWAFAKESQVPAAMPADWEAVDLPHCWNAVDGQDGGNDYYRGTCCYAKTFAKADLPQAERYYLELQGANSSAAVYLNGEKLAEHHGGYSTWRVELTGKLQDENLLVVTVDNAANETVYPQMADFTFYGGIYRDVNVICVSQSHFDLDYFGGPGLKVTPAVDGKDAHVEIECWLTDAREGQSLRYSIVKPCGCTVAEAETAETKVALDIADVRLWNGRKDPYLYTAKIDVCSLEGLMLKLKLQYFGY